MIDLACSFDPEQAVPAVGIIVLQVDETLETDADGECSSRGFLGEYQITATRGVGTQALTVALQADGARVQVVLE